LSLEFRGPPVAEQLQPHTLGTLFALRVRLRTDADPVTYADLSAAPVTLVLDNGPTRITLRWLNGGSDGVLEDDDTAVKFSKSPVWSAESLSAGLWQVRVAKGSHATAQQLILYGTLEVIEPSAGALPTAEDE
jgi:hypothetical protein